LGGCSATTPAGSPNCARSRSSDDRWLMSQMT
jgi:hypothetical protein